MLLQLHPYGTNVFSVVVKSELIKQYCGAIYDYITFALLMLHDWGFFTVFFYQSYTLVTLTTLYIIIFCVSCAYQRTSCFLPEIEHVQRKTKNVYLLRYFFFKSYLTLLFYLTQAGVSKTEYFCFNFQRKTQTSLTATNFQRPWKDFSVKKNNLFTQSWLI